MPLDGSRVGGGDPCRDALTRGLGNKGHWKGEKKVMLARDEETEPGPSKNLTYDTLIKNQSRLYSYCTYNNLN